MDRSREDILREKSAKEVFLWMQKHPGQADAEVAAHFNSLAREEHQRRYPDPDFLPTIPNKKRST